MGRVSAESRAMGAHVEARTRIRRTSQTAPRARKVREVAVADLVVVQDRRYQQQRLRSLEVTVMSVDEDQNLAV